MITLFLRWLLGCWHDWEHVEGGTVSDHYFENRVCLKCGRVDDRLNNARAYFARQEAEYKLRNRLRQSRARELLARNKNITSPGSFLDQDNEVTF